MREGVDHFCIIPIALVVNQGGGRLCAYIPSASIPSAYILHRGPRNDLNHILVAMLCAGHVCLN